MWANHEQGASSKQMPNSTRGAFRSIPAHALMGNLARGGGAMNTHPLPTASLQPYQQLAVRFALHRFFAHYHCPCPDHHEWHTDCLHEALYAVLRADTNEPPTTPSARGLEAEDDLLLAQDAEVQGLWERLSEAERERVLWLARQVENALKRYWRREHRFYGCTEALVVLDEEGEWVEREIENREALDALESVLERVDRERFLAVLRSRLDERGWAIVKGLLAGKSQVEIAWELGLSASAISQRLCTIAQKAAQIRREMGWEP
jgi:DNA-directed RNA polymerase specialized sigma24 family protein